MLDPPLDNRPWFLSRAARKEWTLAPMAIDRDGALNSTPLASASSEPEKTAKGHFSKLILDDSRAER
jgi:hypothetical protein